MLISPGEIIDLIVMTLAIGFIFKDIIRMPRYVQDPITSGFDIENFKFTCLVIAPAIVLHEMAHKFVALGFGINATFHASYPGLLLGVVLRLIHSPFIAFIPGFVSTIGGTPLQNSIIAVAGPLMNLALWLGSLFILKKHTSLTGKQRLALIITKQINMFLFIFNMIPFPPFDGGHFISGLMQTFF